MVEITYVCRIASLFGLFAAHASDLALLYYSSPDVLLKFHVVALFMIIVSICILLFGHYLDISLALCDSTLFGFTVGIMIINQTIHSLTRYNFMIVYILFLLIMLLADIYIIFERKFIYHDVVTDAAVPLPEIRVNPSLLMKKSGNKHHGNAGSSSNCSSNAIRECSNDCASSCMNSGNDHHRDIELGPTIVNNNVSNDNEHSVVMKYPYICTESSLRNSFKVDFSKLPPLIDANGQQIQTNHRWDDFKSHMHVVDSSSCHIYRAMTSSDQPVILKLIKLERMSSALAMSEFEAEGCILARVRHPHIIRLLGCGSDPRPFLVLEVLEGGTLAHSLGVRPESTTDVVLAAKRSFTYIETLTIAISLASALEYLHGLWNDTMHVLHRDLKPDNIGWTEEGYIKIFDFGLCTCIKTDRNDMSETFQLTGNTGTLRYMAPEVALGKPYNYTVDVYSFAIIIWQVFKGKVPFSNFGKKAFIAKVVRGGLRPPLDPIWPDRFKMLLEMCWHADKTQRPSFSVVLAELEALLAEAQERQRSRICWGIPEIVTFLYSLVPLIRRLRPLAVVAAVTLLIAGCSELSPAEVNQGRITGASIIVFACSLLYLLTISYWKTIVRVWLSRRRAFGALEGNSHHGLTPLQAIRSTSRTVTMAGTSDIAFNPISSQPLE